ncbi:MAG: MM0924 family protein [Candidatus Verstraetearchaeota archaeon]|nr:MM0924 family protein [Candidatus Verstraetearchaeota archaeon]
MDSFIQGHLLNQEVDVYCGNNDKFSGKVIACAEGVLTLETEKDVYTHIAIDKIVAIWKKKQPWTGSSAHR